MKGKRKKGGGTSAAERPALTEMEARFAAEFMVDRSSEATALRCGFTARGARRTGQRYMMRHNVRAEIERREHERSRHVDLHADDIVRELKRVAFFDIRKLFKNGKVIEDPELLDEDDARALVNFDVIVLSREGCSVVRLEPGNKLKAMEMLGKHLGLFVGRIEQGAVEVVFTSAA